MLWSRFERRARGLLGALILVPMFTGAAGAQVFTGGIDDSFLMPSETAVPSDAFAAWAEASGRTGLRDFDATVENQTVLHTLNGWGSLSIAAATITFRARASAYDWIGVWSDGIEVLDKISDTPPTYVVLGSVLLSDLPESGGSWVPLQTALFTIDLASFPLSPGGYANLLPVLRDGELDLVFGDDSAIDFVELRVNEATPTAHSTWGRMRTLLR